MTRKNSKYYFISQGFGAGQQDHTLIYMTEEGLSLLEQLLSEQDKKNKQQNKENEK